MSAPLLSDELSAELFFLYDTHCPWSYVATKLVNEINNAFPSMTLHLWHTAFFDGKSEENSSLRIKEVDEVEKLANIRFPKRYQQNLVQDRNSMLSANLMTWAQLKTPNLALALLNALQKAHFEQGISLTTQASVADIISELKLSPPAKVFKSDKLTKDATIQIEEIFALQEIMNTQAIPALLLAVDEQLILLNHNFYLSEPEAIVEAVQLELQKHHLNTKNN